MADKPRFEYKLVGTPLSTKERDLGRFEEMITEHLNKGFKLQGDPFFVDNLIYQPMTKEVKVIGPAPTSATQGPPPKHADQANTNLSTQFLPPSPSFPHFPRA